MEIDPPAEPQSVVLSSSTTSSLNVSIHPVAILNISEHLTRLKLQKHTAQPFVFGALLGTQDGRDIDIVNTFELRTTTQGEKGAFSEGEKYLLDATFLTARQAQYKQVFPSLELIGWYNVSPHPTQAHITLHDQFAPFISSPLLVLLNPQISPHSTETLPIKAYEPTIELKARTSRNVYVEVSLRIETGEAERIAVDWTKKGGEEGGGSLITHLESQRAAIQMLHSRLVLLASYVASVAAGQTPKDHSTLRALSALVASLPASENPKFREEFNTEYSDIQITAFLGTLTKTANVLNDLVDKYLLIGGSDQRGGGDGGGGRSGRRRMGMGMGGGTW